MMMSYVMAMMEQTNECTRHHYPEGVNTFSKSSTSWRSFVLRKLHGPSIQCLIFYTNDFLSLRRMSWMPTWIDFKSKALRIWTRLVHFFVRLVINHERKKELWADWVTQRNNGKTWLFFSFLYYYFFLLIHHLCPSNIHICTNLKRGTFIPTIISMLNLIKLSNPDEAEREKERISTHLPANWFHR